MVEKWKPTQLDLGLSLVIAIVFPFIAQFLYSIIGALIPLYFYYGMAWGISKWRRGSTGYFNPFKNKYPIVFLINLGVIFLSLIVSYFARIVDPQFNLVGVVLTAIIWAPINAASEQILWIYIFEAWDLYPLWTEERKRKNWMYRIIGLILFSAFVGSIHTMFWVSFYHIVETKIIFLLIPHLLLTTLSGFLHLVVWRKTNQMIFTFIPHFLLNLIPLFWTGYSILPYLIH